MPSPPTCLSSHKTAAAQEVTGKTVLATKEQWPLAGKGISCIKPFCPRTMGHYYNWLPQISITLWGSSSLTFGAARVIRDGASR